VERLLLAATGLRRHHLLAGGEIDGDGGDRFLAMVGRRRKGEPLQYIEGSVSFGPLELAIDPRALVPRPETEQPANCYKVGAAKNSTRSKPKARCCSGSCPT
jgi:release factor glutamine methyltransferase